MSITAFYGQPATMGIAHGSEVGYRRSVGFNQRHIVDVIGDAVDPAGRWPREVP